MVNFVFQIDNLENDAINEFIPIIQKILFQESSILILSPVLLSDDKSWIHISGCSQSAVSSASHNDLFGRQLVGDDNIAGDDHDNDKGSTKKETFFLGVIPKPADSPLGTLRNRNLNFAQIA